MERTFCIIKPDAVARNLQGEILAMIQAAGYGIAMGNATPDVLAAARYVTDDNNHDGVAKAIETYVLKG